MTAKNDHILIIGTGFAGIGMGIRLKQSGIHDFTILEQASEVGGTWRDNAYPEAACDVPSHVYSFSFEQNPDWTREFATQPEIFAYMKRCVDKYGLRPHIEVNSQVCKATFDERTGVWTVETTDGKVRKARAVISGCGGLSRPALPDIPGMETFEGKTFHTARWDDTFALEGKTVAVIGTGASAIQVVPAIAPKVGKLHLFQRTAPWIMPKMDRAITDDERALFRRIPLLQRLRRFAIYAMLEARGIGFVVEPRLMKLAGKGVLRNLEKRVPDPVLRAKLTPDYTMGCKRILISNDYYPALQRKNVEVVTDGITNVTKHGIVTADGVERKVDVIVCATGFQAAEAVAPFETRGLGGRDLNTEWRDGAEAFKGTTVSGFPNLFFLVGPNTGLGHNSMILMIESQIEYVLSGLKTMRARSLKMVDVKRDVQNVYNARIHERLAKTIWASGCNSWYQTKTGKNTTLYPGFTFEFRLRTRKFDPKDYDLVPDDVASRTSLDTPLAKARAAEKTNGATSHASYAPAAIGAASSSTTGE